MWSKQLGDHNCFSANIFLFSSTTVTIIPLWQLRVSSNSDKEKAADEFRETKTVYIHPCVNHTPSPYFNLFMMAMAAWCMSEKEEYVFLFIDAHFMTFYYDFSQYHEG